MALSRHPKLVLVDMDTCLFDHPYSLRCAATALQRYLSSRKGLESKAIISSCKLLFQKEINLYLDEEAAFREQRIRQVKDFLVSHGFSKLELEEAEKLYNLYKEAYRSSRRAAQGSVQTLVRLRESGYMIASMSRLSHEWHEKMGTVLGLRHLIDYILAREEVVGSTDEDSFLYSAARQMEQLPGASLVVWRSSADSHTCAVSNTGIMVTAHLPEAENSDCIHLREHELPLRSLHQLLDLLDIKVRRFMPTLTLTKGCVVLNGLGLDLVTEPRAGFHISKEAARFLIRHIGIVLVQVANGYLVAALKELGRMIHVIASAGSSSGQARICIIVPEHHAALPLDKSVPCAIVERAHSILAEFVTLTLDANMHTAQLIQVTANYLQSHCNDLMREHPRQAIRNLRSAMIAIAEAAGVRESVVIEGDNIEPWIGSKARYGSRSVV